MNADLPAVKLRRTRTTRAALAVVICIGIAACSSGPAQVPQVPEVFDLDHDATVGIAEVDPSRGAVVAADELRLLLENHMAWHGITLVEAMRAAAAGDAEVDRWTTALVGNTDDITAAIGLVYGPVGARAFHQLWAQHTQFLVDYAAAVGRDDRSARAAAQRNLRDYVTDSGSLLATATGGRLPAETAREVLQTHVEHMMQQLDATAADDRATALAVALDDHEYLFGVAGALAGAIAAQHPVAFPGEITTDHAEHVSSVNQQAGSLVIARLGSDGPVAADLVPAAIAAADPRLRSEQGWSSATDRLDRSLATHDHAATVDSAHDVLTAADTLARLLDPFAAPSSEGEPTR